MRLLALSEHNTEAKKQGVCGENRGGCGENLKFSGEKLKFAGEKKSNHHTTQHVLSPAQIKARKVSAAGTVVEHGHCFSLHDGINRQIDGLECAEENQSKLSVLASVAETARGSQCAVEEQLRPGMPQQLLDLTEPAAASPRIWAGPAGRYA
jgi:hypothetical protein